MHQTGTTCILDRKIDIMRIGLIVAPLLVIITSAFYIFHLGHFQDLYPQFYRPPAEKFPYRIYYLIAMAILVLIWLYSLWSVRKNTANVQNKPNLVRAILQLLGAGALCYFVYRLFGY